MSSVCAEQLHKLHPSQQLFISKKPLKSIDIPPRRLLMTRRAAVAKEITADMYNYDETLLQKFLPYNNGRDDDEDNSGSDSDFDPYSSDHFRMYEFKVRRCTRSRSHDWTDCPFAHPGEKARRRDPRRFHYSGQVCPEYRRGGCSRGDNCEFSHGVFECWLHPARYRTEACKDGKNCKRKICFFAHTPRQLRVLPPKINYNNSSAASSSPSSTEISCQKKFLGSSSGTSNNSNHCCLFCHCAAASSPTSTLLGMSHLSPPLSPPLSPMKHGSMNGFSPISRYSDRFVSSDQSSGMHAQLNNHHGVLSYKDVLTELMNSLDAMTFSEASSPLSAKSPTLQWVDVSFNNEDQQQQFIHSPSTPSPSDGSSVNFFNGDFSRKGFNNEYHNNDNKVNDNGCSSSDPDLGWVNELLM